MKKIDFNKNWTCRCLTRDEEPYSVTLPHDAMRSEPRTEESLSEGNSGWYLGGDYEYTKHVFVPSEYSGKKVLIEFESVYHNAEVYINGKKAAYRPYGYTNFYVDTEGLLKYEAQNEIRVIARNSDQPNSRWYSGTGIYRPVYLWMGDKKYIPVNGIKIHTVSYEPAVVEVEIETSCPGMVNVEILGKEHTVLKKKLKIQETRLYFVWKFRMQISGIATIRIFTLCVRHLEKMLLKKHLESDSLSGTRKTVLQSTAGGKFSVVPAYIMITVYLEHVRIRKQRNEESASSKRMATMQFVPPIIRALRTCWMPVTVRECW